ncbi:hypothetical protein FQA39_LY18157 [Lamprigera yunnana]|nr:hypothetical protein FQA39_LY18157 [Lamprigera yunnana]
MNLKPEIFRLAKHNKTNDDVIKTFWTLLSKILNLPENKNIVQAVKYYFLNVLKYKNLNFYALPENMSSGSRELLLAFGFIFGNDHLNNTVKNLIADSLFNYNMTLTRDDQFEPKKYTFSPKCIKTKNDFENVLKWINGQIVLNQREYKEYCDGFHKLLLKKNHMEVYSDVNVKQLSELEIVALSNEKDAKEFLSATEFVSKVVHNHIKWLNVESEFWEWMSSVLIALQKDTKPLNFKELQNYSNYDHHEFPGVVPRTFIGPLFISILVSPFAALIQYFELNKFWTQYLVRAALGGCVIASFHTLSKSLEKIFGSKWLQWFIGITVTQSHFMFYLSRPLPNIFALSLALLAINGWLNNNNKAFIVFSAAAIVLFRAELSLFLGLLLLYDLIFRRITLKELFVLAVPSGLAFLSLTVVIDSIFWNRPLWPEGEVLWFNTILNRSSEYGTSPFLWYFYSAIPRGLAASLFLVPIGVFLDRRVRKLVILPLLFVFVFSFLPHKELRFIIYVFPLLNVAAATTCHRIWENREKSPIQHLLSYGICCHLILNTIFTIFLLTISSTNYPGGAAISRIHRLAKNETNVVLHIDNLAAQTGVSRFTQIHPNWTYSKKENLIPGSDVSYEFTHLITEGKSRFSNNLKPYSRTHDIIDTVESFYQINFDYLTIPPVKIKTKPVLYILRRKDNYNDFVGVKYTEDTNMNYSSEHYIENFSSSENNNIKANSFNKKQFAKERKKIVEQEDKENNKSSKSAHEEDMNNTAVHTKRSNKRSQDAKAFSDHAIKFDEDVEQEGSASVQKRSTEKVEGEQKDSVKTVVKKLIKELKEEKQTSSGSDNVKFPAVKKSSLENLKLEVDTSSHNTKNLPLKEGILNSKLLFKKHNRYQEELKLSIIDNNNNKKNEECMRTTCQNKKYVPLIEKTEHNREKLLESVPKVYRVKDSIRQVINDFKRKKIEYLNTEQNSVSGTKEMIKNIIKEEKEILEREELAKIQDDILKIIDTNPNIMNKEIIKNKVKEAFIAYNLQTVSDLSTDVKKSKKNKRPNFHKTSLEYEVTTENLKINVKNTVFKADITKNNTELFLSPYNNDQTVEITSEELEDINDFRFTNFEEDNMLYKEDDNGNDEANFKKQFEVANKRIERIMRSIDDIIENVIEESDETM